jgi:REP-associated tyrosine transposase
MDPNAIKFFTATINSWKHLLKPDKYKNLITESLKFIAGDKRVWIYGFVIMPNHIHLLWRMHEGIKEKDVQRDLLKFTAQKIKTDLTKHHPLVLEKFKSTQSDREYQFWERRAWSSEMHNRKVTEQKLDYIHNNPVTEKWKLSDAPENYHYSSAKYYLLNIDNWGFITHYAEHIS